MRDTWIIITKKSRVRETRFVRKRRSTERICTKKEGKWRRHKKRIHTETEKKLRAVFRVSSPSSREWQRTPRARSLTSSQREFLEHSERERERREREMDALSFIVTISRATAEGKKEVPARLFIITGQQESRRPLACVRACFVQDTASKKKRDPPETKRSVTTR